MKKEATKPVPMELDDDMLDGISGGTTIPDNRMIPWDDVCVEVQLEILEEWTPRQP